MIELEMPEKSQKFRRAFYRWHLKRSLAEQFGTPPTDEQIKKAIIDQRSIKYGPANSSSVLVRIKISAEKYAREIEFPISFKDALRRVIGGRSYSDNLPIFKAYWQYTLKHAAIQNGYPAHEQTDEYVEKRTLEFIEWFKEKGVNRAMFEKFANEIPAWRLENRLKPQRKNAANARWLKEYRKKFLEIMIRRVNALSDAESQLKVKVRMRKMSISHPPKPKK